MKTLRAAPRTVSFVLSAIAVAGCGGGSGSGNSGPLTVSVASTPPAVAAGVRLVCSTDAHSVAGLGNMALSVHTARRGGAGPMDVLNTRPLDELLRGNDRLDP